MAACAAGSVFPIGWLLSFRSLPSQRPTPITRIALEIPPSCRRGLLQAEQAAQLLLSGCTVRLLLPPARLNLCTLGRKKCMLMGCVDTRQPLLLRCYCSSWPHACRSLSFSLNCLLGVVPGEAQSPALTEESSAAAGRNHQKRTNKRCNRTVEQGQQQQRTRKGDAVSSCWLAGRLRCGCFAVRGRRRAVPLTGRRCQGATAAAPPQD